jgi:glutathione S-transferase
VRECLTELGLPFVARQVPPAPEERHALRELAGTDEIPVLVDADGTIVYGAEDIVAYLETQYEAGPDAAEHRRRFDEHDG